MIYLLYGEDTFQSRKKINEIKERFISVTGASSGILHIDAEEGSVSALSLGLESGSLFDEKRLVVVERALEADESVHTFLASRLERLASARDLFIFWETAQELPENVFAGELKRTAAKVQEFKKPTKAKVSSWLDYTLKEKGFSLTALQKAELIERAGADLWRLQTELEKMILDTGQHERVDVKSASLNIFALTDALGSKNKHLALWLLYRFQEDGMEAERMFWTISWHVRNLAIFRSLLDAGKDAAYAIKATKQNPFVIKKGFEQARKFTQGELESLHHQLVDLDLGAKKNRADMALGLERLVLSI